MKTNKTRTLLKRVKEFPGCTASGLSRIMRERSDWASGTLHRLTKEGRVSRKWGKGMRSADAWRYYPAGGGTVNGLR